MTRRACRREPLGIASIGFRGPRHGFLQGRGSRSTVIRLHIYSVAAGIASGFFAGSSRSSRGTVCRRERRHTRAALGKVCSPGEKCGGWRSNTTTPGYSLSRLSVGVPWMYMLFGAGHPPWAAPRTHLRRGRERLRPQRGRGRPGRSPGSIPGEGGRGGQERPAGDPEGRGVPRRHRRAGPAQGLAPQAPGRLHPPGGRLRPADHRGAGHGARA